MQGLAILLGLGLTIENILLAQTASFLRRDLFSRGVSPVAVIAADVNQDGKADLVSCDSSGVSVFLGNGDGSFQAALTTAASCGDSLAVSDFNSDGIPDLAVGAGFILLGKGDGTWQSPSGFGVAGLVVAADFNRDGKADLAVRTDVGATVLLGKGDGTFQTSMAWPTAYAGTVGRMVAADFNGDGIPDLAVSGTSTNGDGIAVLLGRGDGTFEAAKLLDPDWAYIAPYALAAGDFDGDGRVDLVTGAYGGDPDLGVALFKGNGDGTFLPISYTELGLIPMEAVTGDFNGDGKLDLAVCWTQFPLTVERDEWWFVSILSYYGSGIFLRDASMGAGRVAHSIAASDFDGDGKPDLAVAAIVSNRISVLLNRGPAGAGLDLVSAATLSGPLAAESLASLYGSLNGVSLAVRTLSADQQSPPTSLGGLSVRVRDSAGSERLAPMLFVSPSRIDFEVPAGTVPGDAIFSVEGAPEKLAAAVGQIRNLAPGLLTRGLLSRDAVGYATRLEADGRQTVLPLSSPIVLDDRPVYLTLYGSGIRQRSSLDTVQCTIGGISVPVEYADAAGGNAGMDQVNIRLIADLKRANGVLVLTVDGVPANTVFVDIR